jgi:hypothetical protein
LLKNISLRNCWIQLSTSFSNAAGKYFFTFFIQLKVDNNFSIIFDAFSLPYFSSKSFLAASSVFVSLGSSHFASLIHSLLSLPSFVNS